MARMADSSARELGSSVSRINFSEIVFQGIHLIRQDLYKKNSNVSVNTHGSVLDNPPTSLWIEFYVFIMVD